MVYNLIGNIARANQRTRILAVIVKLQVCLIKGLQMNQQCDDSNITVTEIQRGTRVVVENHSQCSQSGSPVQLPSLDMVITTDASKKGWGAVYQSIKDNARWSQESLQHVDYFEVKAAFLTLRSFLKGKCHMSISLQLDKKMVIAL